MTRQRSFKRLVRARMEKTGESYTAARAQLLAAEEAPEAPARDLRRGDPRADRTRLGRVVRRARRLGRGRARRTARSRVGSPSSRESTRWPGTRRRSPSATSAPAACARSASTPRASRSRPRRPSRSRSSGCSTRSSRRRNGQLRERTATRPKSARFDWVDGETRVNVDVRRQGRREEHRVGLARATRRRRGARADEGVVGRAPGRAQDATCEGRMLMLPVLAATVAAFVIGGDVLHRVRRAARRRRRVRSPPWKFAVELLRCLTLAAVVAIVATQGGRRRARPPASCSGSSSGSGFPLVLWTGAVIHESSRRGARRRPRRRLARQAARRRRDRDRSLQ